MKTIDYTDTHKLEELELKELKIKRTRRAIEDTYGEKSPTKKRHKLGGKRRWKNKKEQYNELSGSLTAQSWNNRTERQKIIQEIYKKQKRLI